MSRIVGGQKIFNKAEKEQFVLNMRIYERLYGVRVLTYCIMSNHFHILVEVPRRPEVLPTEKELVGLVAETLGEARAAALAQQFERWREQGNEAAITGEMNRWFAQMWDLGSFLKMVKQRFSQWYNARQKEPRRGTLWEERYRSVLVETSQALRTISLYIDLNPIRAGLVEDPKDYRWSGYGEAMAGQLRAQRGLGRMAVLSTPAYSKEFEEEKAWIKDILCWYRESLFTDGAEVQDESGQTIRRGFSPEAVEAVRAANSTLPLSAYLRLRVRYLTDGAALGTRSFIEALFHQRPAWFPTKRRCSAQPLQGLDSTIPLCVARKLIGNLPG